jgi:hypothetical protein
LLSIVADRRFRLRGLLIRRSQVRILPGALENRHPPEERCPMRRLSLALLLVEADRQPLDLTLGQFFDIWQVRLTRDCLGAYCSGGGRTLRVYVNGELQSGDPRSVVARAFDESPCLRPAGHPRPDPGELRLPAWLR